MVSNVVIETRATGTAPTAARNELGKFKNMAAMPQTMGLGTCRIAIIVAIICAYHGIDHGDVQQISRGFSMS